MTEPMYELMIALRDTRLDQLMPRLPTIQEWEPHYRDHRLITQGLGNTLPGLWGMDGEEAQALLDETRAISQYARTHRDEVIETIRQEMKPHKVEQAWRVGIKLVRREYAQHLHELRSFLHDQDTCDDGDDFGLALEQSPAVYFYTRVVLPSMVLWQTTPFQLTRMARGSKGAEAQAKAIERLVRLDPMAM